MKNLKHYTDWQLISEAKIVTEYDVKEEIFDNDEELDVKNLFANLEDMGCDVGVRLIKSSNISDFIARFIEDGYIKATWNVEIRHSFEEENMLPESILILKELQKIKKRCFEFEFDIDLSGQNFQCEINLLFNKPNINVREILQKAIDKQITYDYIWILQATFSFFCGQKYISELADLIGGQVDNILNYRLEALLSSLNKKRILDLNNGKMIFTYDIQYKSHLEKILYFVRHNYKVKPGKRNKEFSNPTSSKQLYEFFEVIYHNKENNIFDFDFKENENIAFEVQLSELTNDELKKGTSKSGKYISDKVKELKYLQEKL
jgi:hypothetical protein